MTDATAPVETPRLVDVLRRSADDLQRVVAPETDDAPSVDRDAETLRELAGLIERDVIGRGNWDSLVKWMEERL